MMRVMVDREHGNRSVVDRQSECQRAVPLACRLRAPCRSGPWAWSATAVAERQAGSVLPRVSSPKGRRSRPTKNAIEVSATGVPMVWKYVTPKPTRKVMPAPTNRPADVAKANALARQSVGYCSGSHSVYIAKLAPPRPRKNSTMKNGASAFGRKKTYPKPTAIEKNITTKYPASASRRPSASASVGRTRQPRIVPAESTIVPYDARRAAFAEVKPSRSAISRTDVGTYTEPAHKPMIETRRNSALRIVFRA